MKLRVKADAPKGHVIAGRLIRPGQELPGDFARVPPGMKHKIEPVEGPAPVPKLPSGSIVKGMLAAGPPDSDATVRMAQFEEALAALTLRPGEVDAVRRHAAAPRAEEPPAEPAAAAPRAMTLSPPSPSTDVPADSVSAEKSRAGQPDEVTKLEVEELLRQYAADHKDRIPGQNLAYKLARKSFGARCPKEITVRDIVRGMAPDRRPGRPQE